MPRPGVTPAILTALSQPNVQLAAFVQATFASATVYLWSGIGSLDWNGQTWLGLGSFLGMTTSEDAATVEARGMTLTLSGIDPNLLSECLGDFQLGLPVSVSLGVYVNGALLSDPVVNWAGRMDQPSVDVSGDTATIQIACESRLIDMNVSVDRRLTLEDAQMDYPGDVGLQFVAGLQEQTLFWGNYPNTSNNI
ncbi:MAG: hypothetical protein KGL39_51080 [Patescibacteria group bacterium]|nr:hypothetical protein [Patescibacteria group bacterium]